MVSMLVLPSVAVMAEYLADWRVVNWEMMSVDRWVARSGSTSAARKDKLRVGMLAVWRVSRKADYSVERWVWSLAAQLDLALVVLWAVQLDEQLAGC